MIEMRTYIQNTLLNEQSAWNDSIEITVKFTSGIQCPFWPSSVRNNIHAACEYFHRWPLIDYRVSQYGEQESDVNRVVG